MEPDDLQRVWRSQNTGQVTIDAESLLALVKSNHRGLQGTILRRDVLEITISVIMAVVFARSGLVVLAAGCLFVAVFMIVTRYRQHRRSAMPSDSLVAWLEKSRSDVEHQIWLLRNVFWWYILPPLVGILVVIAQPLWMARGTVFFFNTVAFSLGLVVVGSICWGVYLVNQHAVREELQPRLEELQKLVESLTQTGS